MFGRPRPFRRQTIEQLQASIQGFLEEIEEYTLAQPKLSDPEAKAKNNKKLQQARGDLKNAKNALSKKQEAARKKAKK